MADVSLRGFAMRWLIYFKGDTVWFTLAFPYTLLIFLWKGVDSKNKDLPNKYSSYFLLEQTPFPNGANAILAVPFERHSIVTTDTSPSTAINP